MKRCLALCAAVLIACSLTGCLDIATVVSVKKDGSGTITQTVFLSPMLSAMQSMGGEQQESSSPSEAELTQAAAAMGEGVRYVSKRKVTRDNGSTGHRVVFAFDDINTVRVNPMPENATGQEGAAGQAQGEKKDVLTFAFTPGDTANLVVNIPHDESTEAEGDDAFEADLPAGAAAGDDGAAGPKDPMQAQMEAQMKQMFQGFRVRALIRVDGEITDTTASHVQTGSTSGKRQYVTIYDMDIGRMLNNPEQFEKLQALQGAGQQQDLSAMADALEDVDGLMIETRPRVEISFQ